MDVVEEHARESVRRDELAAQRDRSADLRDRTIEERDRAMAERERSIAKHGGSLDSALEHAVNLRRQASSERALAAAERRQAAQDRSIAATARDEAVAALRIAQFDDLTGAYRRGIGERVLIGEVERAQRTNGQLVLALVDVDGLKQVNDNLGHLAGDELLREVVDSIRANIRSYEPVVRLGGDEFIFTVAGVAIRDASERVAVIRADLARRPSRGRFTVGLAELRRGDILSDLIQRADAALLGAHDERHARRFGPS